jgi:alkylation response protein AidB-like acyl-CoA dehydrogenase
MALTYAQDRIQFDRPIGSFQALQHHFADMWIDISGSRILLYKAAWKVSHGAPAAKEVAVAKARIGDAYRRVTTLGHQIFGGIGFTMEHDMHLYHRRSISGDMAFGDAEYQREMVARALGL